MQPWHLWQPSDASNLIKTEINLISDLPDEYDKTGCGLMDLDTYQGPKTHWSWIRGERNWRGGARGCKSWRGLVESALKRCLQAEAWDDSHGWVTVQSSIQSPPLLSVRERKHSLSITLSSFPFPVFMSSILESHSCSLYSRTHTNSYSEILGDIWGCSRTSNGATLWCLVGDYRATKLEIKVQPKHRCPLLLMPYKHIHTYTYKQQKHMFRLYTGRTNTDTCLHTH